MGRRPGLGLSCLALAALAACGRTADIVIRGGMVWTGLSSGAPQPGAVAIGDGEILAVGDSAAVARYIGSNTRGIRAEGGLVLPRSEEHTSELQSQANLVCRLLLEKKKKTEHLLRSLQDINTIKNFTRQLDEAHT